MASERGTNMPHQSRAWARDVLCGAAAVALLHALAGPAVAQTLEQQVALSVQLLELSVAEWQERVAIAPADGTDGMARSQALAAVEKKYKSERARLHETYSISVTAHLTFFARHGADVEAYLEENPDVKARIDGLSQTLRNLITNEESRPAIAQGVPQ
jgi:hypothetical protein